MSLTFAPPPPPAGTPPPPRQVVRFLDSLSGALDRFADAPLWSIFRDDARQATEFYQSLFGGELALSTFGEMYASDDPAEADKIMHGMLETPQGYTIMGADTPNSMEYYFEKLAGSGQVTVPLEKAPWGDFFGMCVDGYGANWLVNIAGGAPGS